MVASFKEILNASKKPIIIGLALNIIGLLIFSILSVFSAPLILIPVLGPLFALIFGIGLYLISLIFIGLSYLINFLVYLYTGYNATKKHNFDVLNAALAGMFSFLVIHTVYTVIALILNLILSVVFGAANTMVPRGGESASQVSGGIITLIVTGFSFAVGVVTFLVTLVGGVFVNAGVAAIGSVIAGGGSVSKSVPPPQTNLKQPKIPKPPAQ